MYWELKENVDVTVWEPAYTESNIHVEKPPAMFTLPTKTAVRDVFNKFGVRKTRGSLTFGFTPTLHGRPELGEWQIKELGKMQAQYEIEMAKKEEEAKQTYKAA